MLLGFILHIKDLTRALYEVKDGLNRFTPFVCGNGLNKGIKLSIWSAMDIYKENIQTNSFYVKIEKTVRQKYINRLDFLTSFNFYVET